MKSATPAAEGRVAVPPPARPRSAPPGSPRIESRTFSKDRDADGIDDYRVTLIDSYDADGKLIATTKEQDFNADGIVDSRVTTTYD